MEVIFRQINKTRGEERKYVVSILLILDMSNGNGNVYYPNHIIL